MGQYIPTTANEWRLTWRTISEVIGRFIYALLTAGFAAMALTIFVVAQNQQIVLDFVIFGPLSLSERMSFLFDLYPFLGPSYGPVRGTLMLGVAALLGVNLSLVSYQIAELGLISREGIFGGLGLLLGTVGASCAACGSAVLVGLLSMFGVTSMLTILPLEGMEFLIIAIIALAASIYTLTQAIASDVACPVNSNRQD